VIVDFKINNKKSKKKASVSKSEIPDNSSTVSKVFKEPHYIYIFEDN